MTSPPSPTPPRARRPGWMGWIPLVTLVALAAAWARSRGAHGPDPPRVDPAAAEVTFAPLESPLGGARLRGTVRSAGGAAVPEALVLARVADLPAWTYTDERGQFELSGLPPGPLLVRVCSRRYEVEDFLVEVPADGERLLLTQELGAPATLPALERAELVGDVSPPWPEWIVTGYEVALIPVDPPQAFGAPVPRRARVAPDRSFRFEGLILGRYRVAVLPPWAAGSAWPDLAASAARELEHTRAGPRRNVPLEAGLVEALVTDVGGAPLEGALVLLHPLDDPGRIWPPFATGADGRLALRDLPPGGYALSVSAGGAEVRRTIEVRAGMTHRVDLPPLRVAD